MSFGVPPAAAYETANFDHLAPTYDAERNVVTFDGEEYSFYHNANVDVDGNGSKETHPSKIQEFIRSKDD